MENKITHIFSCVVPAGYCTAIAIHSWMGGPGHRTIDSRKRARFKNILNFIILVFLFLFDKYYLIME
jgi:hypothetical protein